MAIIELQRRQTEVGRIRLGQKVKSGNGTRPSRLETFRFTSPSRPLIEKIAALYGGDPQPWSPPRGAQEWEVITKATSVPVVVPPQDVESSQYLELWSAGGCQRRCNGQRELISDSPCMCDPDPARRDCKMHTRVNVMLRDVEGIGVWRLDTGGYYAAVELPGMVELLSRAQGLVPALLELRQRTVTREGKTKHFVVPVLHVEDFTPGQLVSGQLPTAIGGPAPQRQALGGPQRQALEAGPAQPDEQPAANGSAPKLTNAQALKAIAAARNQQQLDMVKEDCRAAGLTDEAVLKAWSARSAELAAAKPTSAPPANGKQAAPPVAEAVDAEVEPNTEALWMQILSAAGAKKWNTDALEERIYTRFKKPSDEVNGWEMQSFLAEVQSGAIA